MANEKLKESLEFKAVNVPSWSSFKPEVTEKDGVEYHRKKGSNIIYKRSGEDFICLDCNSEILAEKVAHPVHDGPFPLSGSGECKYEFVPYCPKCEDKPKFHGSPI